MADPAKEEVKDKTDKTPSATEAATPIDAEMDYPDPDEDDLDDLDGARTCSTSNMPV